jgi:hypothetical protein
MSGEIWTFYNPNPDQGHESTEISVQVREYCSALVLV